MCVCVCVCVCVCKHEARSMLLHIVAGRFHRVVLSVHLRAVFSVYLRAVFSVHLRARGGGAPSDARLAAQVAAPAAVTATAAATAAATTADFNNTRISAAAAGCGASSGERRLRCAWRRLECWLRSDRGICGAPRQSLVEKLVLNSDRCFFECCGENIGNIVLKT